MRLWKRATAEFVGTYWLVIGGCGSAVLAVTFPQMGIGFLGMRLLPDNECERQPK